MKFCGRCGLQLAPESTICPRCGEATEPELSLGALHTDDPTVAALPQVESTMPVPPHKLVLGPQGSDPHFGASDPTSAMPTMQSSLPAYPVQQDSHSAYPNTSYPALPAERIGYSPAAGQVSAGAPFAVQQPRRKARRGRAIAIALLLLILLLLLPIAAIAIVNPGIVNGLLHRNIVTPTPVAFTPSDHARMVMQQYYADINNQDYKGAYNLWGSDFQNTHTYDSFVAGYAHTRHDELTINRLTPQADGTVSTDITLVATEDNGSGTAQSTYQGTYIVGQENGVWKILSGTFHKVG